MQRDTTFDQSISNPTHLDMSEEYKANCIDENSLPMPNSVSQFCQDAYFTQIAVLNRGAHSCECHPRGSRSSECEKIGGQCKCHRNIIGRRCHSCRAGFFNFPHCKSKYHFMLSTRCQAAVLIEQFPSHLVLAAVSDSSVPLLQLWKANCIGVEKLRLSTSVLVWSRNGTSC